MRTPSFFLLLLALVNLTAPRARACTADKYGKCGEQPPKTDRYDKPAPKPKAASASWARRPPDQPSAYQAPIERTSHDHPCSQQPAHV